MARCSVAPLPRPPTATLIQPAGLPSISPPPTVQSRRFFRLPGSVPAYSGVQNSNAVLPDAALVLPETSSIRIRLGYAHVPGTDYGR